MSLRGGAHAGSGEALAAGDELPGADWIELDRAARIHVKHGETAREWTLEGPARARLCPNGREEIALGIGTLRSELGPGARPGAEVTIGTAFGAVQYADARAEVSATETELRLTASAGEVWLTPFVARAEPALRQRALRRQKRDRVDAEAAVSLCTDAAARAAGLASELLSGGGAGLGQRAAEHVRARKWARASCTNAEAAVLQQAPRSEIARRLLELAPQQRAWQGAGPDPG